MGKSDQRRQDKARTIAKADERRRVVLQVYQGCDAVGAEKLAELATAGVTPTCKLDCAHCCSLEIPISRAEGEAAVAWLTEHRSAAELDAIRERLRGWLAWYRTEYPRLIASGLTRVDAFFRHAPRCPLLEGNRCGAYPVRPVTCRNHYVSSPVADCDPTVSTRDADVILEVPRATRGQVAERRRVVERQGGDYLASIHLLEEGLAHLLEVEREPWRNTPRLQLT